MIQLAWTEPSNAVKSRAKLPNTILITVLPFNTQCLLVFLMLSIKNNAEKKRNKMQTCTLNTSKSY